MARRYVIADTFATGAAAQDLCRVTVPDNGVTRIIEIHATNEADETSEMVAFLISRATSAPSSRRARIRCASVSCSKAQEESVPWKASISTLPHKSSRHVAECSPRPHPLGDAE